MVFALCKVHARAGNHGVCLPWEPSLDAAQPVKCWRAQLCWTKFSRKLNRYDRQMRNPQATPITRRQLIANAGNLAVLALTGCAAAQTLAPGSAPAKRKLRLIGEVRLPYKLQYQGTTVGGLSGIDFDPATGVLYLLSDDGGSQNPPRFYTARIALSAEKLGDIEITGVTFLTGIASPDPEAIRWHAPSQSLLWTSEGNAARGAAPTLQQTKPDGSLERIVALPAMFNFGLASGPRINKTLEGLAISTDGNSAWLAMEAALRQDGPVPAVGVPGAPCRFTQLDLTNGKMLRQIAYQPDAIPRSPVPESGNADNGVTEILMRDAHHMLVLERAYMAGLGATLRNSLRVYEIDTRQGSNTLDVPALTAGNYTSPAKKLVLDFADYPALVQLDNTEGMAWGPKLANGKRSLLFISDDNFNLQQITQLLAFEYTD